MANFSGLILTDRGRDILAAALTGETLTFTRVALGDGLAPANPEGLATLVSEKRNAPIQSFAVIGNGTSRIRAIVTNVGLAAGFFAREVGVFATDPDTGSETLYAYANAGDQADYLPAAGGATIVEQLFDLITVVDTAPNVVAVINDSLIYATKDELTGVALEGDTLVFPGSTNSYLITNFSSFATYSVSSDIGTATVTGDTVSLVIDAGQASGGLNMIVTRDGYEYVFRIAIGEQSVAQPVIENPAQGVTDVGSGVTITTSEFLTYPEGADTHASTDWQVATDTGFTSIVFESLADASNLEAIAVPSGTFDPSTTYYARARHNGATLGASAYSPTRTFTTKENFYPTVEVGKLVPSTGLSANDGYGNAVALSGSYAIVGAVLENEAYIFERDGAGNWDGGQRLTPASEGSRFGQSVDIEGGRAIVGMRNNTTGRPENAEIWDRDGGGVWVRQQVLTASDNVFGDYFGISVGVSGNYAIVGARGDDDAGSEAGAAYIYERDGAGVWQQVQKLIPTSANPGSDYFGIAVAISGSYAIVGATRDTTGGSGFGAVYIYERDGAGVWQQVAYFTGTGPTGSELGSEVAIKDGRAIACTSGATGHAQIYDRSGVGSWSHTATLTPTTPQVAEFFGVSCDVDGDYAIVGANGFDEGGVMSVGCAYVFARDIGGIWSQVAQLLASDGAAYDRFGGAVAISGSYGVVGAEFDDDFGTSSGAAFIFE